MKARRLIESSAYGPETLRALYTALDDAWTEIAHHFAENDHAHARMRLAHALLAVAREDSRDPKQLKNDALQVMALSYRER
jgi:hypothetical protein